MPPLTTLDEHAAFGTLLREFRAHAGLTQADLAGRAGLSVRGISDLERGARKAPHPHTVRQLADAMQLTDEQYGVLLAAARRGDAAQPVDVSAHPSFAPGSQFGAYEILEQLGQGGMGSVYRAYQASLDRNVAIKVLLASIAVEDGFRERFRREAAAVAQLRHPNILTIFDYGEEQGVAYLVSELVAGGTLASQLGEPLRLDRVRQLLGPIAAALDFAHARGIVHGDVKPSNILLTRDGIPILADFGLSVMLGSRPRLTHTGTPENLAPECAAGEAAGPFGDQYALAMVASEMLTGRVPFSAETPLAIALERALLKALAKNPSDRFATATDFIAALGRTGPTRRRAAATAVAGATLIVALGVTALLLGRPGAPLPAAATPPSAAASPGAGELVLADSLANPASGVFAREQAGTSQTTFRNGDTASYAWDFAYMYSAIVAHVLGPYPANPDGAWLTASATLDQPPPRDFAVQVRAHVPRSAEASAFGLGFESGPDQQYQFYVTPTDQAFRLELPRGQGSPVSGRAAWILPATQPNLLRLEIRGDTLRILINGHELAREAPTWPDHPAGRHREPSLGDDRAARGRWLSGGSLCPVRPLRAPVSRARTTAWPLRAGRVGEL